MADRAPADGIAIRTTNLTKRYGSIVACDNISLDIRRGELFGLLGPNGAGKTTLFNILSTQVKPSAGQATVGGFSVTRESKKVKQIIGIVPQEVAAYDKLTAWENLVVFAELYKVHGKMAYQRANELLRMVSLHERAHDLVLTFSGGMKHRLNIILGLIHDPQIIYFDEPTTGLDPIARNELWEIIRILQRAGKTIVLTTHYMQEAEALCERVAILNQGKVAALGSPKKMGRSLEEIFFTTTSGDSVAKKGRTA
ncbi:MAG TPA: ATP-binding cassette domain-containing protein [Candidatus Thermoplasmatota archaeon]|nr:ATP-binding cassette domain-containing protein [Candidatus Thermoplasmatota archaeon]